MGQKLDAFTSRIEAKAERTSDFTHGRACEASPHVVDTTTHAQAVLAHALHNAGDAVAPK
jgi:hypothetical protein